MACIVLWEASHCFRELKIYALLAGGLPDPTDQALPQTLPRLPRPGPQQQAQPIVGPMSALAGNMQPGINLQVCCMQNYL